MNHRILTSAAAALMLSGCGSTRLEQDYGQSVQQLIATQTYNPSTLAAPSGEPVEGADPDMVNAVIGVFRESVSTPENVDSPIVINVGGGR